MINQIKHNIMGKKYKTNIIHIEINRWDRMDLGLYPDLAEESSETGNGASMCLRNSMASTIRKSGEITTRSLKGATVSVRAI